MAGDWDKPPQGWPAYVVGVVLILAAVGGVAWFTIAELLEWLDL